MNLLLEGQVNSDMLRELVNGYNNLNPGETLNILISSEGGNVDCAEAMICLINRHAQVTTLTSFFRLESSAFDLFFKSKCYREVLPTTMGMIHLMTWGGEIKEGLRPVSRTEFITEQMKKSLSESITYYKGLGVTDAEIRKFRSGEEIYFDHERLKKLLKRAY